MTGTRKSWQKILLWPITGAAKIAASYPYLSKYCTNTFAIFDHVFAQIYWRNRKGFTSRRRKVNTQHL